MNGRAGFTLIELVVVGAGYRHSSGHRGPANVQYHWGRNRQFGKDVPGGTSQGHRDYAARNAGTYPGTTEAVFKAEIAPYIRGPFPRCPVGDGVPDGVQVVNIGTPLSGTGSPGAAGNKMWKYDPTTGEIIINYDATSKSGLPYDEF